MLQKLLAKPHKILLCTFFVYIIVYCTHASLLKKTVYGDGIFYVSWMHSIVIDHDINFTNEYAYFNVSQPHMTNGRPSNKYAIGPAIVWSPFYLWAHTLIHGDGLSYPYQFVIGITSVLYVITGLILLYRLLITWTKPIIAVTTITLLAIATHLLFYGAIDPVNSHGLSFFAATLFLTLLFQKQLFFASVALGLIALIRPQDAIYSILFLPFLNKKVIPPILIGFLLCFSPQMLIWFASSGNSFISPYFIGGEHFSFLAPHLFTVLWSLENGLLVYTPLILFAIIGYFLPWGKQQIYKRTSLGILLLSWYIVASWSTWDQGASYSGRMFIGMLPIIAIALSKLLTYLSAKIFTPLIMVLIFFIPLGLLNCIFILYFLLTHG